MATRPITTIGLEFDNFGIRGAKVTTTHVGKDPHYEIEKLEEFTGALSKDDVLIDGLKGLRAKLGASSGDKVVSCVAGKQIFAAQVSTHRLPDEEMRNALKFEIRKSLPFELAGSTIEYQFLSKGDMSKGEKKGGNADVMVTAVANILLDRHMRCMERAGFKPHIVEVLPLSVANAFWYANLTETTAPVNVILHMGPEVATVVVDGQSSSFYYRTIYFSAHELYGKTGDQSLPARERERRLSGFADELSRSLSYYENNFQTAALKSIVVLGGYLDDELLAAVSAKTGLKPVDVGLTARIKPDAQTERGKYDVAVGLAMRNLNAV